jgi:hypothetical protein
VGFYPFRGPDAPCTRIISYKRTGLGVKLATVAPYFGGPSLIRSLPANLVRPPNPASPRRTGSGGNTVNALAVPRGQARQSCEPAFAVPLDFSDTPYSQ